MKNKIIFGLIFLILIAGFTIASLSNISLNLSPEDKNVLSRVGKGIGDVNKTRESCDEFGVCINESYIDKLQLQEKGCDGSVCYFKLYESGGINKEFKIKLERICETYGLCKDLEMEDYECCLSWRAETDEEVMAKATDEMNIILDNIVGKTLEREARVNIKRFEDTNITL